MPDLLCSSRRFGVHGFSNTPNQQLAPNHLEARTHPSDSPAIGKSSDDQQPSAMFIIVGAVTTQVGALNTLVPCLDQQLLVVGHGIVTGPQLGIGRTSDGVGGMPGQGRRQHLHALDTCGAAQVGQELAIGADLRQVRSKLAQCRDEASIQHSCGNALGKQCRRTASVPHRAQQAVERPAGVHIPDRELRQRRLGDIDLARALTRPPQQR